MIRPGSRAVLALIVVLAVVALVVVGRIDDARLSPTAAEPAVAEVAAPRPTSAGTVDIAGVTPSALCAGLGNVWILSSAVGPMGSSPVLRLDPMSGRVTGAVWLPGKVDIATIAAGAGSLWIADDARGLFRVDPRSLLVTGRVSDVRVMNNPFGTSIATDRSGLWALASGGVVHVETAQDRVVGRIPLPGVLTGIDTASGAVWIVSAAGRVWKVDEHDGRVVARGRVPGAAEAVLADGSSVWVLIVAGPDRLFGVTPPVPVGALVRLDPDSAATTNEVPLATATAFAGGGAIWAVGGGRAAVGGWRAGDQGELLQRIVAPTGHTTVVGRVLPFEMGAWSAGNLWLAGLAGVQRIPAAHTPLIDAARRRCPTKRACMR